MAELIVLLALHIALFFRQKCDPTFPLWSVYLVFTSSFLSVPFWFHPPCDSFLEEPRRTRSVEPPPCKSKQYSNIEYFNSGLIQLYWTRIARPSIISRSEKEALFTVSRCSHYSMAEAWYTTLSGFPSVLICLLLSELAALLGHRASGTLESRTPRPGPPPPSPAAVSVQAHRSIMYNMNLSRHLHSR